MNAAFQTTPNVSVVVVAADSGPTLRECVRRVMACDVPLELILVDNGSGDGVPQAIERALQQEWRLRVIYNRANLGFGPAVKRGATQARGDVLLILNPDCMLDDASLRRLLELLRAHPKAGIVGAFPALNVGATDDAIEIVAVAPCMAAADFDVSIDKDLLTISGERKPAPHDAGDNART